VRALLPEPGSGDADVPVDLHHHYATDWLEPGGIRANMIVGVDGAAAVQGLSGGLQSPGDHRVFAALRDLADVVLVGWATAAAENYGPARPEASARARWGLRPELPIAIVSKSLAIDTGARLFTDNRPLVVTCANSDEGRRAELGRHADVLVCGTDTVDFGAVRAELGERGLTRVLCEGGPRLLGLVIATGELDELCLSLSPLAAGPGPGRIVAGAGWASAPRRLRLRGLLEDDGALFLRYSARQRG
jgi:riboflavin biosynthesis pyrimidine reductase